MKELIRVESSEEDADPGYNNHLNSIDYDEDDGDDIHLEPESWSDLEREEELQLGFIEQIE